MKKKLIFLLFITLLGCDSGPEKTEMIELAKAGRIDEEASIKAEASIMIKAPIDVVWLRLTELKLWPDWNQAISNVKIRGRLKDGKKFEWVANGTEISSEIVVFKPIETLTWIGESSGGTAIHVWQLRPVDEFTTVVLVKESMRGFLLSWFYSSDDLKDFLENWLKDMEKSLGKAKVIEP